jgi:hypothetical protein
MKLRTRRVAGIILMSVAAAPADAAFAAGQKYTAILSEDARTLSYTPCAAEDAAECIAYALDCRPDDSFGGGLRITIMGEEQEGPDVRALARSLLDKPFGEAKVRFTMAGRPPVELGVSALTVSEDEMNGDWDLALQSYDQGSLFDALTKASAGSVKLDVAGYSMTISDGPKAAADLLRFKAACAN